MGQDGQVPRNPVIAVLLGRLVLDERLDWNAAIATALVLTGVVLVKSARSWIG
jgi:uncharacterized membrane protein